MNASVHFSIHSPKHPLFKTFFIWLINISSLVLLIKLKQLLFNNTYCIDNFKSFFNFNSRTRGDNSLSSEKDRFYFSSITFWMLLHAQQLLAFFNTFYTFGRNLTTYWVFYQVLETGGHQSCYFPDKKENLRLDIFCLVGLSIANYT